MPIMLSFISWQQYFLFILVALVVYYSILVLFFGVRIPVMTGDKYSAVHPEDTDEVITTAQQVMDELRPLFTPRTNQQELLFGIQLQLKKYHQWDEPAFRDTIQHFIERECARCSIKLSEDELRMLW